MSNRNLKRYLTGLLAVVMTFTSVPAFVQAETDKDAVILYTNDVHCAIDDYSKFAAYAAQLEEDGQEVIIVDAGDAIQGEVIGTLTEGDAIIDLMNTVGYDYVIPGNHEFDYGMDKFLSIANANNTFEYLSSNFVDLKTESTVFDAYKIVELNGEKIAFVGITTPETLTSTTPTYFQDDKGNYIYGFSQENLYDAVQIAVDAARAEGAQRVIALGHLGITGTTEGWRSTDVIANTTGIDVFLDAHSEEVIEGTSYKNKAGKDVLLSSTGRKFAYFGELTLDDNNVEVTELINPDNVIINSSEVAEAAYKKVQEKIDNYNAQTDYLYDKIGTTEVEMITEDSEGNRIIRNQETNMGDFATDAYRTVTGADIAIANSGGIRTNVPAGDVTRKTLMDVNPYGNELSVVKATGQQIIDALEHGARLHPTLNGGFLQVSGLTYEIHNYIESPVVVDADGSFVKVDDTKERRVTNVKVNGEAIGLDKKYTVAATTFLLLNGGDGFTMFKDCEVVSESSLPADAEMLIQYLTDNLNEVISKEQYGNKNGDGRIKIVTSEEEVYQYLKVNGVSVNRTNAEDILGDGTASYDVKTNTLTLENVDISTTKDSKNYPVYAKGDLNIVLKGENKLCSDYFYGIAIVDPANKDSVNVTISGDGSLNSYGSDGGIFVKGSLKIDGNADITGRCGEVTSGSAYGIRVNNDVEITGNAKVKAKAGSAPENSYGMYSGDNFTACGDAQVNAEGGKGTERSAGLYAISNIYIKDNAVVTTLGAKNGETEKFSSESYGIRTTHMYISGGTLTTTGQAATVSGISAGIYTQDFELTGGTVNANSVDAGEALSIGIQSTKTLKVIKGTLNATSGNTTADSYAIEASGGIDVSGGVVNAVTGHGDYVHGIDTEKVNITGGTVNVYNKGAVSQARGIRSNNEITISGGNVQVEVGDAEGRIFGIQAGAPVAITGGKVFVNTGNAESSSAVYGWGDITIADAEVNVTSNGNGIYAPSGSVNIGCTDVTVDKDRPMFVGTIINIDAKTYGIYGENGVNISENLTLDIPEDGSVSGKVEVEPLGYYVSIRGLSFDREVLVPAGKSVNEAYCDKYDVDDFTEALRAEKEGYTFGGFYIDENCTDGKEYSFDTKVTEDITIFAKWIQVADDAEDSKDELKDTENSNSVQTGDIVNFELYIGAMLLATAVIITIIVRKRMNR